jgi:hypothetical protein
MIVVLAIMAALIWVATGAIRWLRGANVVDTSVELVSVMRRTSQLAVEAGQLHRVVLDLDGQTYRVEICTGGPATIDAKPAIAIPEEERRKQVEDAKRNLASTGSQVLPVGADDDNADEMALALAGQLAMRRGCEVSTALFGDPQGRGAIRAVDPNRSARIRSVWVQHLKKAVVPGDRTDGNLVAIHFFPNGSAEKAIVEVSDGDDTITLLVHGLTGRVETRNGALRNPDDFMLRNAEGDRVEAR